MDADALTPPELRARAEGVAEVCDACHARFRIPFDAPAP